jgi:ATP-binding cassette subfamily F protein 3
VKYGHNVKPGYFAQHQSEMLNSELTVLEEAYSTSSTVTEQEVRNLLGAFLFSGDDVFKKVKVLSGGEKSRLALTKILLSPPNLLLMDEPTNHLDIPSCEILEEGLKKYDGTLILITHDRRLMNAICTGILEVEKGRQEYFIGNYEDYIYKKKLIDAEFVQNGFDQPVMAKTSFDKENDKSEEKESRKDRKRREAQNRIILFKKQEPIRKEIEALEKKLAEREQRSREITTFLSDPTNYERKENIRQILEEEPIVSQDIKFIEKRWEELHIELDEIERSCDS